MRPPPFSSRTAMNEENTTRPRRGADWRVALVLLAAGTAVCGCGTVANLSSGLQVASRLKSLSGLGRPAGSAVPAVAVAQAPEPAAAQAVPEEEEEDAAAAAKEEERARAMAKAAGIDMEEFERNILESKKRACVSNMRQIGTAAENWMIANPGGTIGTADWTAKLVGPQNYIRTRPKCPSGGAYSLSVDPASGAVRVSCSVEGHVVP